MDLPGQRCIEITIPAPWGHISGKWWGACDTQPVLFLHGWQDNAGSFDRLIPLLPPQLSYLCIDLPGHGYSSHYPKGQFYYIFWDTVVVVRRVVQHYSWPRVSIVGHSMGGAAAFLYAAAYPAEVDRIVSLDIACPRVTNPAEAVKSTQAIIDRFLKYEKLTESSQPCYEFESMLDVAVDGYGGSVTRESCEVLLRRGMQPVSDCTGLYRFTRDVRLKVAGLGFPSLDIVLEFADRISCDYMNIRAECGLSFDDPSVYDQVLDRIRRSAKSFHYHRVPGTHHVHLNEPNTVAAFIADFLSADGPVLNIANNLEDVVI